MNRVTDVSARHAEAVRFAAIWFGHLALIVAFFQWTGTLDDRPSRLLSSLAIFLGMLAVTVVFEGYVFRNARRAALRSRGFWLAALFVVSSVVVARLIVNWVPNVSGIGWQLLSFVLRFGLAWTLVSAAWWNLARQAALPPTENSPASVIAD